MPTSPLLLIFIGGGLGSLVRYGLSRWPGNPPMGFPWGTFLANVLACLVLGLAVNYVATRSDLAPTLKPLVLIGFCGGFSTFSTFSLESYRMLTAGQWQLALAYVLASTLACWGIFAIIVSAGK